MEDLPPIVCFPARNNGKHPSRSPRAADRLLFCGDVHFDCVAHCIGITQDIPATRSGRRSRLEFARLHHHCSNILEAGLVAANIRRAREGILC